MIETDLHSVSDTKTHKHAQTTLDYAPDRQTLQIKEKRSIAEHCNHADFAYSASRPINADLEEQVRRRTAELSDANRVLREKQAQLEAVYDHHYQMTGLIDKEGRLLMGNKTAMKFADIEPEEVVGKYFWETPWWSHSKEEQRKLRTAMARAMQGEMAQFESTHVSATGEMRNIEFRIGPVFDKNGKVIYLVPEGYDVTKRLHADAALRKSEEKYRTFFQNSRDPMLILRNGLIVDSNAAAVATLGYHKVEEVLNFSPTELSPKYQPDGKRSSDKAKAMMDVAHAQGSVRFEWEHRRKDEIVFPVEVSITAMPSEGPKRLHVVWRDISNRRLIEESLYRQAKFDSIIAGILARFARCSAAEVDESVTASLEQIGRFAQADAAYVALFASNIETWSVVYGWSAPGFPDYTSDYQDVPMGTIPWTESKIRSGGIVRITNVDDFPPEAEAERRLFKQDGVRSELMLPLLGRDGKAAGCMGFRTYAHHSKWVSEDIPRITLVSEAVVNVLERKRAEESLQHSEERHRSLVSTMQDIIYSVSIDGKILFIGPQVERYGFTVEEIISQPITNIIFPEDRGKVLREFQNTLTTGEQTIMTFRITTRHGNVVWFEEIGRLVYDAKGNITCISGVLRDVTERMRTMELEAQLQQAQKMETIGTLAGGIAHDFNNILSAIMGYAELSKMLLPDKNQLYDYLDNILKAGDRAKALIQQILTFSRQNEKEFKPISAKIIIKEALKLLRASLPASIDINQRLESDALMMGDPTQIHQIVMNLCTNAGYAMKEDGGILGVDLSDLVIDEAMEPQSSCIKPGHYLNLTVSDTGKGIPSQVLNRIFDPFYTTKEREQGTGLGLSIVHGLVSDYGGTINVHSEPGKGSRFEIFLPAFKSSAVATSGAEEPPPKGKGQILFVDDEPAIVDIGHRMLESLGYQVVTRTSSMEALELFRNQPQRFDLVITDMTMPQMTGDKLACEVLSIRKDIPIILCTGFGYQIVEDKANALGIKGVLRKPVVKMDLAKTIRNVVEKAQTAASDEPADSLS